MPSVQSAILFVLLFASILAYGWAIRSLFARPEKLPVGIRVLSVLGILIFLTHSTVLFVTTPPEAERFAVSCLMYAGALGMFAAACRATLRAPLPIAFSQRASADVVTSGPYRYIRHPFYTSYSLTWLACAVATMNVVAWATALLMIGIYVYLAAGEERLLRSSTIGTAYTDYQARTGMFVPRPWAFFRSSGSGQSSRTDHESA